MKLLGNDKALGLDSIPTNVWKLLEVCKKEEIWDRSGIVPFTKKDELRYAKQYRD